MATITLDTKAFEVRKAYAVELQAHLDELAHLRLATVAHASSRLRTVDLVEAQREALDLLEAKHGVALDVIKTHREMIPMLKRQVEDLQAANPDTTALEGLTKAVERAEAEGYYLAAGRAGEVIVAHRDHPHECADGTPLRSRVVLDLWPGKRYRED